MRKSSFIEGTFIATFAIILVKIMGMLYVIPFYWIVEKTGAALYAYAYQLYNVFLDISTVGLPIAISKITNEFNTLKMYDAKRRSYNIAIKFMRVLSIVFFLILFLFAPLFANMIIGKLSGGNTVQDVTSVIRCVSLAILVIPYLSVTKGYLQGHNVINIPSISNVIEQIVRIAVILIGSYVTIKVFNFSYVYGVCVAVLGAFFGGLVAYLYVKIKMHRNKKELSFDEVKKKDKITDKELIKKIASYAIPYIIINCVSSLYSFVDMLLVLRGLEFIGYDAVSVEVIATSVITWAGKINMIIISIAMGMTISLIPSIVSSFTLKKWKDVNNKINTALKMILFISLPMTLGLSVLCNEVWAIFYGASEIGGIIISVSVFVGLSINIYMITSSIMQSLNCFKIVYISSILGFVCNGLLDVPLILLFNKIGIPPYLGALVASIFGYLLSASIALIYLHKKEKNISFRNTFYTVLKMIVPSALMVAELLLIRYVLPVNLDSKLSTLIYLAVNTLVGAVIYLGFSYLMGLFNDVFGEEQLDRYMKKLKHLFKH